MCNQWTCSLKHSTLSVSALLSFAHDSSSQWQSHFFQPGSNYDTLYVPALLEWANLEKPNYANPHCPDVWIMHDADELIASSTSLYFKKKSEKRLNLPISM